MSRTKIRTPFPLAQKARRHAPRNDDLRSPTPISRAAQMLALAHHVESLIESEKLSGYADAARSLGLTRARLTQVMNLLLLAPEIQEQVLVGVRCSTERSLRCVVKEPCWRTQAITLSSAE